MIMDIILLIIGALGLIIGTITDFQKREVADLINYGMIFSGIGIRVITSIITGDYFILAIGIIWLLICYLFGMLMYYSGQWGGGDCKMIMGLGALFGTINLSFANLDYDFISYLIPFSFKYNISFMAHFLFNSFLVGAIYGLIYTIVLMIKNWKKFREEFILKANEKISKIVFIGSIVVLIFGYVIMFFLREYSILLQGILILLIIMPNLLIFVKVIEKSCMIQMMKIKDLTEGEWIVDDVIINKKYITGPKELGITLEQIRELQNLESKGKIHEVKVKIGIPFVPAFLIAFIVTLFFNNLVLFFFL